MARNLLKRMAFAVGGSVFVTSRRLSLIKRAGVVTVLNLHRVSPPDGSAYRALDPKLFHELLSFLRTRFRFGTFEEAVESEDARPKAILSFDDGYKDFIEVTAPILDKLGISCNQNVIPECVESGLPPLNVLAQDFIGKAPSDLVRNLEIPKFGRAVQKGDGKAVSSFIKNRSYDEQLELKAALLPQFHRWHEFSPTRMMDQSDIREIASYHEVGAHSYSHATMGFESDEYVAKDVVRCRLYFDRAFNLPLSIYAFPNGSYRPSQIAIVRSLGIKHVLLVGNKFDADGNVHSRFTFDARSASEARFKGLGGIVGVPS